MAFGPTERHVGEHRQDGQLIIIIPKSQRIMPEQNDAENDNDQPGAERPKRILPLINADSHRCRKGNP